ncbi:MAG: acyltransferase [Neisseria sp.]|nr:acyltransferase [Neisseria sp.]
MSEESDMQPIDSRGNYVDCNFDYKAEQRLRININGQNNRVKIYSPPILLGSLTITINANNCMVEVGQNIICRKNTFISLLTSGGGRPSGDLTCKIGDDVTFNGNTNIILAEKDNSISVGKGSLFANNVTLSTTDSHAIFCTESEERINPAQDIFIGNHVWLCENVTVLKGSYIPNNCVCGIGSIINQQFSEENTILAGIPAKIVRRNIRWEQ